MNIEDVIALSKAGFTSDQIMQMAQAPQQATAPQQIQQPPMQQQVQTPVQMQQVQTPIQMQQPAAQQIYGAGTLAEPFHQPAVATMAANAEPPAKDPFQQLFEQMTGIKQAIQSSNIQNSQMQGAAPQTTDDILASIIQPTKPKEDK